MTVDRVQMAEILGLPGRTFDRLVSRGVLPAASRGGGGVRTMFEVGTVVRAYLAHKGSPQTPRDRLATEQAKLTRLRYRREKGALVSKAEHLRRGQLWAAALAAKLRDLPHHLARVGAVPADRQGVVEAHVADWLHDIARWDTEAVLKDVVAHGDTEHHGDPA